jgi:hypothetical protein
VARDARPAAALEAAQVLLPAAARDVPEAAVVPDAQQAAARGAPEAVAAPDARPEALRAGSPAVAVLPAVPLEAATGASAMTAAQAAASWALRAQVSRVVPAGARRSAEATAAVPDVAAALAVQAVPAAEMAALPVSRLVPVLAQGRVWRSAPVAAVAAAGALHLAPPAPPVAHLVPRAADGRRDGRARSSARPAASARSLRAPPSDWSAVPTRAPQDWEPDGAHLSRHCAVRAPSAARSLRPARLGSPRGRAARRGTFSPGAAKSRPQRSARCPD